MILQSANAIIIFVFVIMPAALWPSETDDGQKEKYTEGQVRDFNIYIDQCKNVHCTALAVVYLYIILPVP